MEPLADHPDLVRLHGRSRSPLADATSRVFDPLVVVSVLLLAISLATSPTVLSGFGWAALAAVFCAVAPEVTLRALARRGRVTDRQLPVREQRHLPHVVALGSVVVGLGVLRLAGAPPTVSAFVVTVLTGMVVVSVATAWGKVSIHTAVAASMTVVLTSVFGPWGLAGAAVVLSVGWARWRAGRHTVPQVLVGCVLGLVSGLVFPLLTR